MSTCITWPCWGDISNVTHYAESIWEGVERCWQYKRGPAANFERTGHIIFVPNGDIGIGILGHTPILVELFSYPFDS